MLLWSIWSIRHFFPSSNFSCHTTTWHLHYRSRDKWQHPVQKREKDTYEHNYYMTKNQGRGRRLLKFSYMHHPTKNDVTSGLNWASYLVSQSEKMAFRLFKIPLCLWTICFVSVYNEDGKIFQAHTFDFLSKNFWKREQFSIVLKENIGDPSVIEWRNLHICETDVAQTFGSCRSWFSDNAKCNSL